MSDTIIMYENGKAIGGEGHPTNADEITFDNTGTDLVSEEVESAIKEVNAKGTPRADIATVESGTTASRAYSVGELVYVSGTLYRVKTAIASGATFTVGTNIEVTNVSNALNEEKLYFFTVSKSYSPPSSGGSLDLYIDDKVPSGYTFRAFGGVASGTGNVIVKGTLVYNGKPLVALRSTGTPPAGDKNCEIIMICTKD